MIRRHPVLAGFVLTYLVGFGVMAASRGNQEFVFYSIVMVALCAAVVAIDARVRFSAGLLWALGVWGLAHMAGGNVPIAGSVLYNYRPFEDLPKYDQVVHAYGFCVATFAGAECVRAALPPPPGTPWRVSTGLGVAFVCIGMGLGALNEVIEFVATLLVPETNVGDARNTGWDLVSNLTGAAAAGVALRVRHSGEAERAQPS